MDPLPSGRRKACDLCTIKRIRCDGLKPLCTNCSLYGTECKMTPLNKPQSTSRASDSSNKKKRKQSNDKEGHLEQLEARLARIESLTRNLSGDSLSGQPQRSHINPSIGDGNYMTPTSNISSNGTGAAVETDSSSHNSSHTFCNNASKSQLQLPPLEAMMPTLDLYFRHYNSVVPLFDEKEFMRMVHGWSYLRSPAEWAAINVVLALGYRVIESRPMECPEVALCISNIRSILMEMMMRTEDFLGLQVLLGTVLLYQGTSRSLQHKDTPMLMGAAARLVEILRLNSRSESKGAPHAVALHRSRLFWIAYFLDKDTAAHFGVSPILVDSGTDHVPPSPNPSDGVSNITTLDGTTSLNFLHYRVQLALHKENSSMIARLRGIIPHFPQMSTEHLNSISDHRNSLPSGWDECVEYSRNALHLSTVIGQSDYYLWHDSCSLFAAGLILLVNAAEYPDSETADDDQWLVDKSLDLYERLIKYGPWEKDTLHADFHNLKARAKQAVTKSHEERMALVMESFLDDSIPPDRLWTMDTYKDRSRARN
uniref:Zn(2)-C6 fungal-type domain-containing protein n=1 Tax=Bionectria ochroleuca TaxID=29856 RepID=A0A0B7JS67_BIOOC